MSPDLTSFRHRNLPFCLAQGDSKRLTRHVTPSVLAFACILLLTASLRLVWLEQNGFGTPYYAAAVRSMTMSWHNLFFAAFDPSALLAIDKPPIAFWLQVASVKLLGFDGFALHLPQAMEGIASVALLYHFVRRGFGQGAGLLAALFLAITPISVAVDRSNNTDSCLVLMQLLAAWPLILAAERASLPMLLLSAAILGIGFNVKMAAVLLVLPGFIALYVATAPIPMRRRIMHLAAAAIALTVVSMSWPLAVELTPPTARPYVDSTLGNSMLELTIGHNALDRFVRPGWLSIVRPPGPTPPSVPAGPLRLVDPLLASQIGWLAPLALTGLWFCRGWSARLLWVGWACVCAVVFSAAAGIFLPYYLAQMAPPLAVLAAIGVTSLRRSRHIAAAIVLTALWQSYILWADGRTWSFWLIGVLAAAAPIAAILLLAERFVAARIATALGVASLLAAPFIWSIGPVLARGNPTSPTARPAETPPSSIVIRSSLPIGDGLGNRTRLLTFLSKRRGAATYLVATTSILEASLVIIRTGDPVMVLGGYTGTTPVVSQADLARFIANGKVRYVLIGGAAAADPASPLDPLITWVRNNGHNIDSAFWRPPIPTGSDPVAQRRATYLTGLRLYDLAPD